MSDPRTIVERELGRVEVRPFTLGTFHARRERKRRNQRLAAGALGISIALAVALIASQVAIQRDRTGSTPTARNGAIAFEGDRGLILSDSGGTGSHRALLRVPEPPGECLSDSEHPCNYRGLAWSPDGMQLAFVFGEVSAGLLGDMSLYVMDATTHGVRLLASCPAGPGDLTGDCDNGDRLSWSPDGGRIAISSGGSLFLVDAASGDMTQITGCGTCSYRGPAREPTWAPVGDRIAFTGNDLMVSVAVDGSARQTLVRSSDAGISADGADPRWSPDGTRLTFSADEGVYIVNADGSQLRLLIGRAPGAGAGAPSWSPDGRRILYVNTPGSGDDHWAEIRVVDVTGQNDRVLFRSSCCVSDWRAPVFSPDGTMVSFSLQVEHSSYVFVMATDGGDVHRLPGHGDPAWQALPR